MNPSIFKAYDIRGIYQKDIDEEKIAIIIKAIYSVFQSKLKKKNLKITIGHDMRVSSPSLFAVAINTLTEIGADVYDIGLASTPTVYYATLKYQSDAGIQISASHNTKEYNGLKFAYRVGNTIHKISGDTGMSDVKKLSIANNFHFENTSKGRVIKKDNTLKSEVSDAISFVDPGKLPQFKIVADPANAMGVEMFKEFFSQVPADLIAINNTLDGTFPVHQADPLQFNLLKDLQAKVVSEKADFGIAPDGDGDRVFFIDEKGSIIPATMITALVTNELLKAHPNSKILVDIRYTKNTINMCKKLGGIPLISRVGHALITEQLNNEGAIFAGESSGHYYFKETGGAESSLRVILMVMKVLAQEKKPLSKIIEQFHSSFESGEFNFKLPESLKSKDLIDSIIAKYKDGQLNTLDGIAIDYPDWRLSVRTSNTEPLLRLNVEADTKELSDTKRKEIEEIIVNAGGISK